MTDYILGLKCLHCGKEYANTPMFEGCPECQTENFISNVMPVYNYESLKKVVSRKLFDSRKPGMWAFKELMPVEEKNIITLYEGGTPLIKCDEIGKEWGLKNLYIKDESRNPTNSFKDRLTSVAISKAKEIGSEVVTIASTGNHGASTAAYASKAGLKSVIFTLENVPQTMKTLMQIYGAVVVATKKPEDRWAIMKKCVEAFNWYPTGNYLYPPVGSNFYGIEGYKTIAFEICKDLGWKVPDKVIKPSSYGDGLIGIWRGFQEFYKLGLTNNLPKMIGVEPFGPFKNALEKGINHIESVETDETIAFSIATGISAYQGLVALRESGGDSVLTEDKGLVEMQNLLGKTGIYAEASSVASLLAVKKMCQEGKMNADEIVVCIITSTGLRDTQMTARNLPNVPTITPVLVALKNALAKEYGLIL